MSSHRRTAPAPPGPPAARPAGWRLALAGVAMAGLAMSLAACTEAGPGDTRASGISDTGDTGETRFTRVPPATGVPGTRRSPEASPPTTGPPLATRRKPEITEQTIPNRDLLKLRGRILDGVEPGCVLLQAEDGGTWLLIGAENRPLPAGRVQVTGYAVSGLASTCQQGNPFRVVSIVAL